MKIQEVRELTTPELKEQVYSLKAELLTLRFQQKSGELENGKKITEVRRSIAKMLTVLRERELAENRK